MRKYILVVVMFVLITALAISMAACSNVGAPVIKLEDTGMATWSSIEGAIEYEYCIDDTIQRTSVCQVKLAPGQSIKVRAVLKEEKTTEWSKTIMFVHIDHKWEKVQTDAYIATPATCTERATYYMACSICGEKGEIYTAGGKDLTNHDWQVYEVISPTCNAQGYTVYYCTRCDIRDNRDYTQKLNHTWEARETIPPTCTEQGYTTYECPLCHEIERRDVVDALDHEWVQGETIAPTCTTDGYTSYTCSRCHITDRRDYVDALNHVLELEEKVLPSCFEQGYSVYHCSRCDTRIQRDFVAALPHDYTGVYAAYTLLDGSQTCMDGLLESVTCTRCKQTQTQEIFGDAHVFNHCIYDLNSYGCAHGGTVDHMTCACGMEYRVEINAECSLIPINDNTEQCEDPTCAFKFLHEQYVSISDDCYEINNDIYSFFANSLEDGLTISHTTNSLQKTHNFELQSQVTLETENGLQIRETNYRYVCSRCGIDNSYGYEKEYFDNNKKVRLRTADYTIGLDGMVRGNISQTILVSVPYGSENEQIFVEELSREEWLNTDGDIVEWHQTVCNYDGSIPYCQCELVDSDSNSLQSITRIIGHQYRYYGTTVVATCTLPGEEIERCIWCGELSEPQKTEPKGHIYSWSDEESLLICLRCGKATENEDESVYLQDVTATQDEINAYAVQYYEKNDDSLQLSAKIYVQSDLELLVLDLPDSCLSTENSRILISFEGIQEILQLNDYTDYIKVRLFANDCYIDLKTPYVYQFRQTESGLERTRTNVLTSEQTVKTMPYTVNEALSPLQIESGAFIYSFTVDDVGIYDIQTTGLAEDSHFTFVLYDIQWRIFETNAFMSGTERLMRCNLPQGTYYLVPSYAGEEPYPISLDVKRYCNHQYEYQFVQDVDVITQVGECVVCHDPATHVEYTWHISVQEGLSLVESGSRLMFAFVAPTDSDYRFESEGAVQYSTSASLYDAEQNLLSVTIINTGDNNFAIGYACEMGKTYYLAPVFSSVSNETYALKYTAYCEHSYVCTYEAVENGVLRKGACSKCGLEMDDVVIPMIMQTSLDVALVISGNEELSYLFTPLVSGTYMISFIEKSSQYIPFVEMYCNGEYLDYEEEEAFYIAQKYELEAGMQYTIKASTLGEVPDDAERTIWEIGYYISE